MLTAVVLRVVVRPVVGALTQRRNACGMARSAVTASLAMVVRAVGPAIVVGVVIRSVVGPVAHFIRTAAIIVGIVVRRVVSPVAQHAYLGRVVATVPAMIVDARNARKRDTVFQQIQAGTKRESLFS
jgi:hypothetical protein